MLDFLKKQNKEGADPIIAIIPGELISGEELGLEDVIAPSALKIGSKEIGLGEKLVRTFFITSYPRILSESWFSPLINLDRVYDISIFVHPVETVKILKVFQKKVAEVQSQINDRVNRGLVRDPKLDTAYQDLENLRDKLQQAQERIFDVGIYIALYADTEDELRKAEGEMRSILESRLVYVRPALFQQAEGFRSVLPVNKDELAVNTKLNSEPLSSLFPFVSFDLTSDKGVLYGINRHNSSLVLFDRFSLENYNSITFAKSGSGKSFATKLEILRSLMFDTEVIVIDPEREYEYLAEATGGRLHWNDPGMDAFEQGWKDFPLGTRVEVRTAGDIWRTGTVVETLNENERGIAVKCDERWHDNLEFYDGRGATVMVFMNTRRGILSNIRRIVSKK